MLNYNLFIFDMIRYPIATATKILTKLIHSREKAAEIRKGYGQCYIRLHLNQLWWIKFKVENWCQCCLEVAWNLKHISSAVIGYLCQVFQYIGYIRIFILHYEYLWTIHIIYISAIGIIILKIMFYGTNYV